MSIILAMIMSVGWLSRSYKSSIIWYGGVHTAMPFLFYAAYLL